MINNTMQKKIKLLYTITENEEKLLTPRQLELINFIKNGLIASDLNKAMKCSRQNVSAMIKNCVKIIERSRSNPEQPLPKIKKSYYYKNREKILEKRKLYREEKKQKKEKLPRKKGSGRKPIIDYAKYKNRDFSALSPRQREVLEIKANFPETTVKEIAEKIGISTGATGTYLHTAVQKLEGNYIETKRKYRQKYAKNNSQKIKEYKHNYYLKNKERLYPKLKESNKRYYLEHREEILERRRSRKKEENKND